MHTNQDLGPLLLRASALCDSTEIDSLLARGAPSNFADSEGRSPLFFVCNGGNVPAARALIRAGANVNAETSRKVTPLKAASGHGHIAVVRLLIESGANLNARSTTGTTALMIAAANGHLHIVKLLLRHGARRDFFTRCKGSRHPSRTAASWAAERGHREVARYLLG
jgi:ankyrin repeat protein